MWLQSALRWKPDLCATGRFAVINSRLPKKKRKKKTTQYYLCALTTTKRCEIGSRTWDNERSHIFDMNRMLFWYYFFGTLKLKNLFCNIVFFFCNTHESVCFNDCWFCYAGNRRLKNKCFRYNCTFWRILKLRRFERAKNCGVHCTHMFLFINCAMRVHSPFLFRLLNNILNIHEKRDIFCTLSKRNFVERRYFAAVKQSRKTSADVNALWNFVRKTVHSSSKSVRI